MPGCVSPRPGGVGLQPMRSGAGAIKEGGSGRLGADQAAVGIAGGWPVGVTACGRCPEGRARAL